MARDSILSTHILFPTRTKIFSGWIFFYIPCTYFVLLLLPLVRYDYYFWKPGIDVAKIIALDIVKIRMKSLFFCGSRGSCMGFFHPFTQFLKTLSTTNHRSIPEEEGNVHPVFPFCSKNTSEWVFSKIWPHIFIPLFSSYMLRNFVAAFRRKWKWKKLW